MLDELSCSLPASDLRDRLERAERRPRWVGRSFRRPDLANSKQVFSYLGRYAAGMVIHAGRILDWDRARDRVTISLGARASGQVLVLSAEELTLRFSRHVLPLYFQRIRHAGLYASHPASRARLRAAQALLAAARGGAPEPEDLELLVVGQDPQEQEGGETETRHSLGIGYWERHGLDYRACPDCGGRRVTLPLSPAALRALLRCEADLPALLRSHVYQPRAPSPVPAPVPVLRSGP